MPDGERAQAETPQKNQARGGSFAFGQVRRPNGLTEGELVFQSDNLDPDMTTGGRGLLESVLGSEGLPERSRREHKEHN